MLRMNIGGRPEAGPSAQYVPANWTPLDDDPFGPDDAGPVQARGATGQGGADAGAAWTPLEFDPFEVEGGGLGALTGPQPPAPPPSQPDATPQTPPPAPDPMTAALTGPGNYMYDRGTQPSAAWVGEEGYFPGLFGQGTSRLVPSEEPTPEPPQMGSRTGTPPNQPAPFTGLLDFGADAFRAYTGMPEPQGNWADRAAQVIDAAPVGTARVPDMALNPTGPAAVAQAVGDVAAQPYQPARGDGSQLTSPNPGVVTFDPQSGDQFGGHASNAALLQASLIPLTSPENLEKRIQIYANDLDVPPDRFFTMGDQIKYADRRGQVFSVAPTIGGGDIWNAPVDMAQRVATQAADNFGTGAVHAVGTAAGMLTGPEMYGPAAVASSALFSGAADVIRQATGNKFAERAGYRPQQAGGQPDIDFYNSLGQAALNGGYEAFARVVPTILARTGFERLFGANPFRLSGEDAQDLARVIEDDLRNGGSILRRANVAAELGLPLSPATLLQVTRGVGGTSADMINTRNRLFNTLAQKENTLASLGGKRGAEASQFMREHYTHWARDLFPRAVTKVVDRISPVESPTLAFQQFQQAADSVLGHLQRRPLEAGHRAGWGALFSSPAMANAVPVINLVDQRLTKSAGGIRAELERLKAELVERATYTHRGQTAERLEPVTDIQRLHQVRLHVERRISELKTPGKSSDEAQELLNELEGVHDMLRAQLNRNPLYFTGDRAFTEARAGVDDARKGILSLLRQEPRYQERLGGPLADSGPTTIAAARKLFEEAGQMDAWNAHTRAYLETHLRGAGAKGGSGGLSFANEVASQPKLHAGLMEMVATERERELLDGLIDAGFAMDQRMKGITKFADDSVRPDPRSLNPQGFRVAEKVGAVLSPLRSLQNRAAASQLRRDTGGARDLAFEMSMPALKNYQEMHHTVVPLAGTRGEVFERGLNAAAPAFEGLTDMIPRPSPTWAGGILAPILNPPPQRDPTASDLAPLARRRMMGLLGPAPQ